MALERQEVKNPTGIVTDIAPADLPLEKWSFGNNVRFKNGKAQKALGHTPIFDTAQAPILDMFPFIRNNIPYWLLCGEQRMYLADGTTVVDVSPGGHSASVTSRWSSGSFNGVIFANNPSNYPYVLMPQNSGFIPMPNWPANTFAKRMKSFKNFMIALNVTQNSVEMPQMVWWSTSADAGGIPVSWDPTDPTKDAGQNTLADTNGAIVDGVKLRDSFIIYKEDSVYSMRYIGGLFIFQFQQLFNDVGILGPNCAIEFDGNHFVVGHGDVYVHNGVQKQSVIDAQVRKFFFSDINPDNYQRTFVIADHVNTEMWVCYSSTRSEPGKHCDRAIIWNWKENTWSIRDLPNVLSGAYGIIDPKVSNLWDDDPNPWDTYTSVWGEGSYNPAKSSMIFSSFQDKKLFLFGNNSTFSGQNFVSTLERSDIYLGDDRMMKTVSAIIPHITGNGTCNIWVGNAQVQGSGIRWKGPYPYRIGQDYKIDTKHVGRYIALKFDFSSEGDWYFNGYTIEMAPKAGMR
ncbi:hypothetical protein Pa223_059 [Pseudomonas virus Pa223]|uniref:Uncharacterized protein n=1 Tax=Pseudomonas virus Pa223 TaxID=2590840 RepID=UPI0012A78192|nr:hypothetical protein Pa223_059 [Pseudomonas virus Pa223]